MPRKKSETEEERQTTSIKISPSVWREFKKYAIDEKRNISALLEDMIKEKLEQGSKKHA
ncbi:MAG: ribbon-helix-helix protein, CopG family [Candidatus Bathyarchaeia archaeon]